MKKVHRELQAYIAQLPHPSSSECRAAVYRPIVALKERVLFFQGSFAPLRFEQSGFDPLIRFLLDCSEAGNPLAIKARDEIVTRDRILKLGEPCPDTPSDYWKQFFTANEVAWKAYQRSASPWLFTDPNVLDMNRFTRDPLVDAQFNDSVLSNLAPFGFRRLARSFQSEMLGEPLIIKWDKGTYSMNMSLFLQMPHRHLFMTLGEPFSSGACFDFTVSANVGARLRSFFRALASVFPEFVDAISKGMKAQDTWLSQTRSGSA